MVGSSLRTALNNILAILLDVMFFLVCLGTVWMTASILKKTKWFRSSQNYSLHTELSRITKQPYLF